MATPQQLWNIGAILGSFTINGHATFSIIYINLKLNFLGAHKIKNSEKSKSWEIATYYQLIHSIALIAFSNLRNPATNKPPTLAGSLIAVGFITPVGGILMMAGWVTLLLF
ncbi:1665_t:CDS:2 [Scutellospora calospora]|uniref:1665_t:CDS:1 n=1 Tax=Scutellospora calospora TaxID=85575 RepID=A0ACA9KIK0_9GLOM|nr:1665_t:CDS:2 [Scutellospora calospora]